MVTPSFEKKKADINVGYECVYACTINVAGGAPQRGHADLLNSIGYAETRNYKYTFTLVLPQ